MKILLIEPPALGRYGNQRSKGAFGSLKADIRWPPIDLMVIAGYLRKNKIDVELIDAGGERLVLKALLHRVSSSKAGIAVINTSTTTIYSDLKLARALKQELGKVLLGAIGVHVMALPKETLALCRELDFAVFSEPEIPVLNLCRSNDLSSVNGICYRKLDSIFMNPAQEPLNDLDELGRPAHDLVNLSIYKEPQMKRKPLGMTMVSRGCINRCLFCSASFFGKYRLRSIENVMDELRWITNELGVKELKFYDDGITYDRNWAEQLFKAMISEGIDLTWNTNIRADSIDRNLALLMKKAGCHTVNIGLESASQKILDAVRKNVNIETARCAVYDCKKAGLEVCGYFVLGLPGETKDTIKKSVDFAKDLDLDLVTFNTAVPHPGTDFFKYLEDNRFLRTRDWGQYDTNGLPVFDYPGLPAGRIYGYAMDAYREFYLRPHFFWKRAGRITSLVELKNAFANFIAFLNNFLLKKTRVDKDLNPSYWYDAYFNSLHPAHWFYARKMDTLISLIPPGVKTILDCGTASALLPHLLEKRGYSADGFDIIEEFVAYGKGRVKKGRIYVDDITSFNPPENEKYDSILCVDVIKRFPKEARAAIYGRISKNLQTGGHFILCYPSRLWFRFNAAWRFFRRLLFPKMIFQDEVCGRNKNTAVKVTYYDVEGDLASEIPECLFCDPVKKSIVFNLLDVVIVKRKEWPAG